MHQEKASFAPENENYFIYIEINTFGQLAAQEFVNNFDRCLALPECE